MKWSQLSVSFFLLIHGVASLPSPPPALLPLYERSQSGSGYQDPTTAAMAEAQVPTTSRDIQDVQSARSTVLSGLSMRAHHSPDEQIMKRAATSPRPLATKDVDDVNTPLESRALMRHPPEWRNSVGGLGVLGILLSGIGGIATYMTWRRQRERKKKEEEEARARAQAPGAQPPHAKPGAKRDLGGMSRLEVRWVE
ncbi:hypothetical protein BCV69DRAFT_35862 [Microstroma glucosiphilum]|uniref:Mid2 domain-containing protein n=1 Tax=Pseudomicrostroma glucosiphilum TaxID=1684307 RepID=A0A316U4T6_9BASI|nr:hypothetical protein BCV69DRAFT_35862 [Pseudomicrostroma glucosiphilum]PWN19848.1 hypothetical protein BCV69DRAFT_35862 [Pseudomicrostroma glucosiphilum]